MIPKRAWYYWEGEPMSWLREQSLETFARLNPGWSIEKIPLNGVAVSGDSRLARVLRSDWSRYRTLSAEGGVYFDTDIVFCKPFPEAWLNGKTMLPAGMARPVEHIAVIGSEPGNRWFGMLDEACGHVYSDDEPHNYQAFGVLLINKFMPFSAAPVSWVPTEAFLPVSWEYADDLWRKGSALSPMTYGVHWFGGDCTSQHMEARVDKAWAESSPCLIAQAWRQAAWR